MGRKVLLVIDLQQDFLPGGALAAAPGSERIVPVVNKLLDTPVFDLRVASTDWHPEVCRQPCLLYCCNQHLRGFRTCMPSACSCCSVRCCSVLCKTQVTQMADLLRRCRRAEREVHRVTAQGHISFASTHGKSPGESVPHRGIQQPLWPEHCVQGTPGADHPADLTRHRWDHVVRKGSALDADASSPFRDLHGADLGLAAFLRERGVQARLRAAVRPCWWGRSSARTPAG